MIREIIILFNLEVGKVNLEDSEILNWVNNMVKNFK